MEETLKYQACWQAAQSGDLDALVLMIKVGRIARSKSMYQAIMNGHTQCVQYLLSILGVRTRYLICAVEFEQVECFKVLDRYCQTSQKLHSFRTNNITLSIKAATRGDLDTFKYLVSNNYRMNFTYVLEAASLNNRFHIVEYCVRKLGIKLTPREVQNFALNQQLYFYKFAVQHADPPFDLNDFRYSVTLGYLERCLHLLNWNDKWWRDFLLRALPICQNGYPRLYHAIINHRRETNKQRQACNMFLPLPKDVIEYCINQYF
jgi:hypothetical protein